GREAVLRHLAEAEMDDAVHPDEFRQRFAQAAALRHPNLAATLEVLEIDGRPAVLQEWLTGLAGAEWAPRTAAPRVWYRLVSQAARARHTAHQAGLPHGHVHAGLLVLTGEGVLRLCGLGEPPWLGVPPVAEDDDSEAADLRALGQLAAAWAAPAAVRKGVKAK